MDQDTLPPTAPETLPFEAALAELEQIVQRMEDGQLTLEDSLSAYRRGAELLRRCQGLLEGAGQQIQILEQGLLRDLESPDTTGSR